MIKSIVTLLQSLKNKNSDTISMVSENHICALDLGRTRLLCVEGVLQKNKIYIQRLACVPLNIDVPLSLGLKILFDEKKCSKEGLRLSLKSPQVVTRFLRFPKMSEKELRGVLQYEIEQYVPYETKDIYLDLAILQESIKTDHGESTEIFVAVAKKEHLDSVLRQFQEIQANVDAVDVDILACMKCLDFFYPEDFSGQTSILDLGVSVTTLGVIRGGQPRFIRDLSFGSQDMAKKLKSRAGLGEAEIHDFLEGKVEVTDAQETVFSDSIESLINDVKVSFDYYRDQSDDGAGADSLFVCGLGSAQPFILEALQKALDVPVKNLDLSTKIELGPDVNPELLSKVVADLAVALGLLLREYD